MLPDKWNNSSLAMYVDDGRILAWAEDWESVCYESTTCLSQLERLRISGIRVSAS
jgi:hypothetical protein